MTLLSHSYPSGKPASRDESLTNVQLTKSGTASSFISPQLRVPFISAGIYTFPTLISIPNLHNKCSQRASAKHPRVEREIIALTQPAAVVLRSVFTLPSSHGAPSVVYGLNLNFPNNVSTFAEMISRLLFIHLLKKKIYTNGLKSIDICE